MFIQVNNIVAKVVSDGLLILWTYTPLSRYVEVSLTLFYPQVKCHHKKVHTGIDSIFRCQFHTAVVGEELRLVYKKADLDDAYKDKRFGDNVCVELLFESIEEYNAGEW